MGAQMSEAEALVGQTLGGRYRVIRALGHGGMGSIYVAEQAPLGRQVALKVVSNPTDPVAQTRFKREARIISQLLHPNIVTLHDFGTTSDGALFIAMELLVGESLGERIDRAGAMPWQQTIPILKDIASGLRAAHELGVVHRDLQPDNVMLVEGSGRGDFAKLLDFGLARLTQGEESQRLTQAGSVVGTPGFVAPECLDDDGQPSEQADLYSLGAIWFEMLTGEPPFSAPNAAALILKHATDPLPLLDEIKPGLGVPREVEATLRNLMEKAPADRVPNASTLLKMLDRIDPGASSPNPPAPKRERFDASDIHSQSTQLQVPSLPRTERNGTQTLPPGPATAPDAPTWADDDAGDDASDTVPYPDHDATTQENRPITELAGSTIRDAPPGSSYTATELIIRPPPRAKIQPEPDTPRYSPLIYVAAAVVFALVALGFGTLIYWLLSR